MSIWKYRPNNHQIKGIKMNSYNLLNTTYNKIEYSVSNSS